RRQCRAHLGDVDGADPRHPHRLARLRHDRPAHPPPPWIGAAVTGAVVWLTGLPSAGKSTIAAALAARLTGDGRAVEVLDGDVVRAELCADLGYSRADRNENVRRIGYVADLLAGHGVVAICPVVSPYRSARDSVRERVGAAFVEVWVSTPVEVCA